MCKLITSARGSDDLCFGFDRDQNRRRDDLTSNKNTKRKSDLRILFKDVFG